MRWEVGLEKGGTGRDRERSGRELSRTSTAFAERRERFWVKKNANV